ncbi:pyruvate kinase [Rhizoctonia solani 123E]|uniref:Pyruvate kinase n=1 Tax=Rhizoctonia solani 123E TaxID=1423351 RepID=A0A074S7S5_9AGAM|nr:pyruvate kinase [Rhizoctonia solani 123E]
MSIQTDQVRSRLEWLSTLSAGPEPSEDTKFLRKTSIIATIGPKVNNVEMLGQLRKAGMNVVRMNFSHGSYEYHQSVIDNVHKLIEQEPDARPLAIALDTKGPEIRTGLMRPGCDDVKITAGHEFVITVDPQYAELCDDKRLFMDYANLPAVTAPGKLIYVDDGILSLLVLSIDGKEVHVRAVNNGTLSSRKGVNLPKTPVDLPALSEKDKKDLQFGVKNGVDMVFASFIRRAQDVIDIREVLGPDGAAIKIIVKIENEQGVENFDEILREADGVMVARGDLGIEIPASQVFIAQKMMIAKCNIAGKPVICATQMLESMTYNPRPTRAEVSDVANAVLDGADCVMLSGETAKGSYPIQSVLMMAETCYLAESAICYPPLYDELRAVTPRPTETAETVGMAAVAAAQEQGASAILVLSTSGNTARLISKYRPSVPIITITRNQQTARQIHLHRGCYPFWYPEPRGIEAAQWQLDVDNRIRFGLRSALKLKIIKTGTTVIAVQGWKGGLGHTNTLRILSVPTDPADLEGVPLGSS